MCKAEIWTQHESLYRLYAFRVWGAPGYVTGVLLAETRQKVDEFEPIYLYKYRY